MVQFCCVEGCGNRSNRDNKQFFRLPHVPRKCDKLSFKADIIMNRKKQWLMNINREDLKNDGDAAYSTGYIRVCSDHFVCGKPSAWSDVENIDWAPTVMMGYDPRRRRRILKSSQGIDGKVHHNRGRLNSTTALKRKLKVQELKMKQKLLKRIKLENVSEQRVIEKERYCEKVTQHPIIHKITVDRMCIVKQEPGDNQNVNETEIITAAENGGEIVSELKFEAEGCGSNQNV